jgi:aspartate-semialdehyde dehydrogenase
VFCAVDMPKDATAALEDDYARAETPVVSNNSAHRWTPDVPMIIPEINDDHAAVIEAQRRRLGTKRGFVTVKPNCSIQSYVPAIHPLKAFGPDEASRCARTRRCRAPARRFASWPEMVDNVIPFIKGEEEKSEQEPRKIWGQVVDGRSSPPPRRPSPRSASGSRSAMATWPRCSSAFERKPGRDEILAAWRDYAGRPQRWAAERADAVPALPRGRRAAADPLDRDAGDGQA